VCCFLCFPSFSEALSTKLDRAQNTRYIERISACKDGVLRVVDIVGSESPKRTEVWVRTSGLEARRKLRHGTEANGGGKW
jgi:hypothetical protein